MAEAKAVRQRRKPKQWGPYGHPVKVKVNGREHWMWSGWANRRLLG